MDKSPDAFRTISEVAEWLDVQAHVLRFWESKFTHVKPVKRAGGRRYYRPNDMQLLGGIKKLLHDDGLTVKGVQKILREQGVTHVSSLSQELCEVSADAANAANSGGAEATVLPFKEAGTAAGTKDPDDPSPAQIEHVATDENDKATVKATEKTTEKTAEKTTEIIPESSPEPATGLPSFMSVKAIAEPEPEPEPDSPPSVEDKPSLPSFLHRPARDLKGPETTAPDLEPEPPVAASPSLVVEAPDPPPENDLPYTHGPLAKLANCDTLSPARIAEIAPLARQLQAWLARSGVAGAS